MCCKLLIAPPLVVPFHFVERITGGRSRSIEHPCTLGATPSPKTLFFDPDQFAAHDLPGLLANGCGKGPCERRVTLVFERNCDQRSRFIRCSRRGSAQVITSSNTPQNRTEYTRAEDYRWQRAGVCGVSNAGRDCYLNPRSSSHC
jgi:hypothetical protein